jgi:hypothetical protein
LGGSGGALRIIKQTFDVGLRHQQLEAWILDHSGIVTEQSITAVGTGEVEATLGLDFDDILIDKAAC